MESQAQNAFEVSAGAPNVKRERGWLRTHTEYAVAWTLLKTLTALPRRAAVQAGIGIGWLASVLRPGLKRTAEINLRMAMPELNASERKQIIAGSFRTLGRMLGEVSHFPDLERSNVDSVVRYVGLENYLEAHNRGRGVIMLTGHIGAWELSVFSHAVYGYPASFLARRIDNPLVERLAESYRARVGNRSIDKRGSLREVMRTLKAGGSVGILADLNATREEGVFVDFFGIPASTTAGVAALAQRTGCSILLSYLHWDEKDKVHYLHFEPVETIDTGNPKADLVTNTANYANAIEKAIRTRPDQWLWIHKRWRTRPEGEKEIY